MRRGASTRRSRNSCARSASTGRRWRRCARRAACPRSAWPRRAAATRWRSSSRSSPGTACSTSRRRAARRRRRRPAARQPEIAHMAVAGPAPRVQGACAGAARAARLSPRSQAVGAAAQRQRACAVQTREAGPPRAAAAPAASAARPAGAWPPTLTLPYPARAGDQPVRRARVHAAGRAGDGSVRARDDQRAPAGRRVPLRDPALPGRAGGVAAQAAGARPAGPPPAGRPGCARRAPRPARARRRRRGAGRRRFWLAPLKGRSPRQRSPRSASRMAGLSRGPAVGGPSHAASYLVADLPVPRALVPGAAGRRGRRPARASTRRVRYARVAAACLPRSPCGPATRRAACRRALP